MTNRDTYDNAEPAFGKTLRDDFHRKDFKDTVWREFRELKEFMLTEEQHRRLEQKGRVAGFVHLVWWLLKHLFFKLSSNRRVLLIIGLLFLVIQFSVNSNDLNLNVNFQLLGGLVVLFILMLELKDKLLAHEELEAGRAVQNALMPERCPKVEGWDLWLFTRPANEVGGDFVDFMKVQEARYGIALADVAGKGLRAALLTAKLQATLRALASDFSSLSDLGAKVNDIFCRDSLPNLFASLVYFEIEPYSGHVRMLNAGHLPPLIVCENDITQTGRGGPALGILPGAAFVERRVSLDRGQVLFAYSDGVTEARDEGGDFFGDRRLQALLGQIHNNSAERIGIAIMEEIDRFAGAAQRTDDLTIAVLKRS
jgi:phosphoserine phosphatase RsbU/P